MPYRLVSSASVATVFPLIFCINIIAYLYAFHQEYDIILHVNSRILMSINVRAEAIKERESKLQKVTPEANHLKSNVLTGELTPEMKRAQAEWLKKHKPTVFEVKESVGSGLKMYGGYGI
jgi:hypothetical protein